MDLGHAELTPNTPCAAGSLTTLSHTYTAGHCIDDGGFVKIVFHCVGDFGDPQFDRPAEPNYCTVHTTGDCRIFPRWDPFGHIRPLTKALYLHVKFGHLDTGEQIRVVFGDRSQGSPGWRLQSFCQEVWEFKTLVDPIGTYVFKELPRSPAIQIVPGPAVRAVCIAPSQVRVGEPFDYHLKIEDAWGNPVDDPAAIRHPGVDRPGVTVIEARHAASGFEARSNPVEITEGLPGLKHLWADFHGQSEETIGTDPIEHYFRFARDRARLDICGHQGNDFQVTDAFWEKINQTTRQFYQPDRFVTFPGYEWSGNSPLGGDRNVYFASEGGTITRSSCELLPGGTSAYPDSSTATELFANLKGPEPFVFAHVGGRYADIRQHDPALEIAMEVHSCWGTFEWLIADAFELGYRIGICANSDDHKCRPGASYPGAGEFGSYGGLTCVLSERLDRDSVVKALKARHFYATTGNRALLNVSLSAPGHPAAMMGDVVATAADAVTLTLRWAGTAPMDIVEIRNGMQVAEALHSGDAAEPSRRVKVVWSGAEVRGRNRMATWNGELRVGGNRIAGFSPINFWKPETSVHQPDSRSLSWQSVTTGGVAGVILELEKPDVGSLRLDTTQGSVTCDIADLLAGQKMWSFGGLQKQLCARRLPDAPGPAEFNREVTVTGLRTGDNPLYVNVQQEDGHMAWSSPVYVVRE